MKAVILAGGYGTRISEESVNKPKPMVEIGGRPILWHIMKILYHQGIKEFIICGGYKQQIIRDYFAEYFPADVTFDFSEGKKTIIHDTEKEDWKVTVVDTGLDTMTGGRLKRIGKYLDEEDFLMTYGDGVANIDIQKLIEFHKHHGKLATVTAAHPVGRFGLLDLDGDRVTHFEEKTESIREWINGGFMVLNPKVLDYIDGDDTAFENGPLQQLSHDGELMAYRHSGFWHCMDNIRDKQTLEKLWNEGNAPWKIWE